MISKEDAINRLNEFRNLEEDWDSYGASPINELAINRAIALVHRYPGYIQYVCPLGDGGVEIHWASFNELNVDVYVGPDNEVIMNSMLKVYACRTHDNVSFAELDQIVPFATGQEEGERNYQANKKRADASGQDVSEW